MRRNNTDRPLRLRRIAMAGIVLLAAIGLCAQDKQPDYTSKVPSYTFADTLEEQEEQLKNLVEECETGVSRTSPPGVSS